MILIIAIGVLFLFLSLCVGYFVISLRKKQVYHFGFFESLLTGVAGITVYLNILSLFVKTDYLLLIPLVVVALFVVYKSSLWPDIKGSLVANAGILFHKRNALVSISFLLPLILYIFVPPYNTDSGGYHYLSILWNEKYKAVPGLANLFPQYGYNSCFFVLSAAFSFTDVFIQSIYPINGVLVICFFLWMLKRSYGYDDLRRVLIWIVLIICLRYFPINLASPSADSLASMLVFYILFKAFDEIENEWRPRTWMQLLVLGGFAAVVKLSTAPIMLVAVVPLLRYTEQRAQVLRLYVRAIPLLALIIGPWLIRNIILSGYMVFPFPSVDLFAVDWKVPLDVTQAERLHILHAPRMVSDDWKYVDTLSISQWLPVWLQQLWKDNRFNLLMVIAALASPVLLLIKRVRVASSGPGKLLVWCISCAGLWFWILTSPDVRFGFHYMLPCIVFLLLLYFNGKILLHKRLLFVAPLLAIAACLYYDYLALQRLKPYSVAQWVVYPLKDPGYYRNNDLRSFNYVLLNNNVKLYIHDSLHHSMNAPLPSCSPYRDVISMRGNNIEDGFKTAR